MNLYGFCPYRQGKSASLIRHQLHWLQKELANSEQLHGITSCQSPPTWDSCRNPSQRSRHRLKSEVPVDCIAFVLTTAARPSTLLLSLAKTESATRSGSSSFVQLGEAQVVAALGRDRVERTGFGQRVDAEGVGGVAGDYEGGALAAIRQQERAATSATGALVEAPGQGDGVAVRVAGTTWSSSAP